MDIWNLVDIINNMLFVVEVCMYCYFLSTRRAELDLTTTDYIVAIEIMGQNAISFYQITAINILLSAFKTFKYLRVNKRLYVLWETMYEARVDLASYTIMFGIIFLGFLFFGWLTFGPDISDFDGFVASLGTLLQFVIGNPPDYGEMTASNRVLGPLYYALFTVFVFFILVNMFIAIISGSYGNISEKAPPITVKQLRKPLNFIRGVATVIKNRQMLHSETELLQKLGEHGAILQNSGITTAELNSALKAANIPVYPVYTERLKEVHRKRQRVLKGLQDEAQQASGNDENHRSTMELRPKSVANDGGFPPDIVKRLDDIDKKLNMLLDKLAHNQFADH